MNRKLLILFVVFNCLVGNIFAQNAQNDNYAVSTTLGGTAKDVSHFSFGIKGGIDYLRISDQKVQPEFGGFLELTINPLWGIGLEYMYMINNHALTGYNGYSGDLESTIQGAILYGSLNLSNVIAKYRSLGWQKWNLYANVGAGISIYDYKLTGKKDGGKIEKPEKTESD
jgi:hypothetical protein